jgi:hypothetical protein
MKHKILAENISKGSGGHGLKKEMLEQIFQGHEQYLEDFCYTIQKLVQLGNTDFLSVQEFSVDQPDFTNFTIWHHIDEPYKASWGFDKKDAGCYIYGLYPDGPPSGLADFMHEGVIYIGESRAATRNCMLGRRKDFACGVKNDWVSPMGNSQAFIKLYGKEQIKHVYQAYLPMHSSLVKMAEMDLIGKYYMNYNRVPACNPDKDLKRVKKMLGIVE